MKTQHFFIVLVAVAVLFTACKKDEQTPQVKKEVFSGYAQKGPFVNGSAITIVELDANLNQIGKTYSTTIVNNSGSFEQKNIELISRYVELKAEGFYFNEISGQNSGAPITLYSLADIEAINSVNVNVLTHLEKPRVEYLVRQGSGFAAAKKQAQREVLAIFGFEPLNASSEGLSLTNDAALLAVSCILQGVLSTGDMMELMANIIADIKEDGKLDNMALGSKLLHNALSARFLLSTIRDNLTKKYSELGMNVTIPDFESYIEAFTNSGLYPQTLFITYPTTLFGYDNILSDYLIEVYSYKEPENIHTYCVAADVPDELLGLKIVLKDGLWSTTYTWGDPYDEINKIQEFIIDTRGGISFIIQFYEGTLEPDGYEYITIEYYESGGITPTKVKKLQVVYPD